MRIDAHQHFWQVSRGDYGWIDGAPAILKRDYQPEELAPILARFGFDKSILVQAAQSEAETDYMLSLAQRHDFIAGVVGWLDMESDDFPARLAHYRRNPKFVGLRPMLQDLPDDGWICRPKVLKALHHVAESGLAFDFLTFPRHLPFVRRVMELVPGLRAVIDHLSKPPIKAQSLEPWRSDIAALAEFKTLSCKVSGMITEAAPQWRVQDLEPYLHHVARCFGPDRLIFGSDWPVCGVAGSYGEMLSATLLALPEALRGDARIFGANAAKFYSLPVSE